MTDTSKSKNQARAVKLRRLALAMALEPQPGCLVTLAALAAVAVLPAVVRKHR